MSLLAKITEVGLDVLLQKDPSSKLLRNYIKQITKVSTLPVCTSWEEWKEWFNSLSQPTESSAFNDLERFHGLLRKVKITANAEVEYWITSHNTHTTTTECPLPLSIIISYEVENVVAPLLNASIEELEQMLNDYENSDGAIFKAARMMAQEINSVSPYRQKDLIRLFGLEPPEYADLGGGSFQYDEDNLCEAIADVINQVVHEKLQRLTSTESV